MNGTARRPAARVNRLGLKLLLITLVALALLAAATAGLVTRSFRQSQREVTGRSAEALEAQGRDALVKLLQREREIGGARLQQGAATSQLAAQYLADAIRLGGASAMAPGPLARGPAGQWFDASPARASEVFIPNGVTSLDAALERDLRESLALDTLAPGLMARYPDVVAVYYIAPSSLTRYYPIADLASILPPDYSFTGDATYTAAAPAANPGRGTVWRPPYVDPEGRGLLVTVSTPVYAGGEFRGVIGVDVALRQLIDHLFALKPTLNGYAFVTDDAGRLIAAPPSAVVDLLGRDVVGPNPSIRDTLGLALTTSPNPALRQSIEAMRRGQTGVDRLDLSGKPSLLAYAPLPDAGWRLGLVAPLSEMTEQSGAVAAAIGDEADRTIESTLLAMAAVLLLAMLATALVSHRLLTRPIAALVAGTRAIGAGDLGVRIPVATRDELGDLADSFNRMAGQLAVTRGSLEQRTDELTHANEALQAEIAERRQVERELREREAQYRGIFEATGDGLVITDFDGVIVEANPAMCAMHGYRREELLGRHPTAFIHPDYHRHFKVLIATVATGEQFRDRAVDLRKDGTTIDVEVYGTGFLYRGRPHVLGVVHDITERVRAYELLEQRVAERTRELSTLLELSHNVAATLELQPLLGLILDGLKTVVDYTAATIYARDGDELVALDYRGPAPQESVRGSRFAVERVREVWEAVTTGAPLIVGDLHQEPHRSQLARVFGEQVEAILAYARSRLYVPLQLKERAIGLLVVSHAERDHFAERDARLAGAIASQAAVAIENAELYTALQQRLTQVEGLSAVGRALVEERNLERVLRTAGERVLQLLDADGCAVALLDADEASRPAGGAQDGRAGQGAQPGHELELAVVIGTGAGDLTGRRVPLAGSLAGEAIRQGAPVLSQDAQRDPRGFTPLLATSGATSFLAVPLQTSERTVGALVAYTAGGKQFGPRDVEMMPLFAQQAAVAIENARLYGQAQGLAVLEERQRLARELHDSVSQALYGIALGAHTARTLAERDPGRVLAPLDYVLSLAEAGLAEMRALIFELRPESLAEEGLVSALEKQAGSLRARHNLAVEFDLAAEPALPLAAKEALYRIAQEALHNTVKHARASRVALRLAADEREIVLEVRDDGIGFDPGEAFPGHLGLKSMRERAERLGGSLDVDSAPGRGACLCARIPQPDAAASPTGAGAPPLRASG